MMAFTTYKLLNLYFFVKKYSQMFILRVTFIKVSIPIQRKEGFKYMSKLAKEIKENKTTVTTKKSADQKAMAQSLLDNVCGGGDRWLKWIKNH
ncbi:hypothetical protein C6H64_17160 [Photorhabdus luminescens]|nr:hypothetical protein C6H64_17160 [Photorhabdus luminescens]